MSTDFVFSTQNYYHPKQLNFSINSIHHPALK